MTHDGYRHLKEAWAGVEREYINRNDIHLLCLGQTRTGKTQKMYYLEKKQLEKGKTIVHFDSGKSNEILPLLNFGIPIHVIMPKGMFCEIKGAKIPITYASVDEAPIMWSEIKKGAINIFTFRRFFREQSDVSRYGANLMRGLVDCVYDDVNLPAPLAVHIDEFAQVCPSDKLMENTDQSRMASRFSLALKTIGSQQICISGYDQNWRDVYPNARRQFPMLLACRSPGFGRDSGIPERYDPMFASLRVEEGIFIFPWKNWDGVFDFPLFTIPEGISVRYAGQYKPLVKKGKRRVIETWQRVAIDDTG